MSMVNQPQSIPTTNDVALARASSDLLTGLLQQMASQTTAGKTAPEVRLQVPGKDEAKIETVPIPACAVQLIAKLLEEVAQGNAVTIVPVHTELTTQEAAALLNVSRPFVVKLIETEQLPCKMVGSHRRILLSDLLTYKQRIDSDRLRVLDELAAEAQELGLGY